MPAKIVRLASLVAAVALTPALAQSPAPSEVGLSGAGLTVAILDLSEAPDLLPPPEKPAPRASWRTSFGSERKSEVKPKRDPDASPLAALWDTDAVLIQGVSAGAPLRRLFPPKTWRLVVSRQVLVQRAAAGEDGTPTVTAIAVRAREGLRVTAREMSLRLDGDAGSGAPPAAATAVRIMDRGRAVWLASITLPPSCGAETVVPCAAKTSLAAWRQAKRGSGEATLVGGRIGGLQRNALPQKSAACAAHAIETELKSQKLPTNPAVSAQSKNVGCISIIKLDDQ